MITVTETSDGAGTPRVVMKEIPDVKPIGVSVKEARLEQQMAAMPSPPSIEPEAPVAAPTAPAEDDMAAIRAAIERRKQLLGVGTPSPATAPATSAPAPASTKICPSCGNELPAKAKFCNKCGGPM